MLILKNSFTLFIMLLVHLLYYKHYNKNKKRQNSHEHNKLSSYNLPASYLVISDPDLTFTEISRIVVQTCCNHHCFAHNLHLSVKYEQIFVNNRSVIMISNKHSFVKKKENIFSRTNICIMLFSMIYLD